MIRPALITVVALSMTLSCSVRAQSCSAGYTPVSDTLTAPSNTGTPSLFNGNVIVAPPTVPISNSSVTFIKTPLSVTVTNGVFFACLAPNDTASPSNTTYPVSYFSTDGTQRWVESWSVPTSATALTVRAVRSVLNLPPPFYQVAWSMISIPSIGVTLPGVTVGTFSSRFQTVAFSATPTFDMSQANVFKITLTGNVTAPTFPNANAGETYTVIICQDATGNRTWVWPVKIHGGIVVGVQPNNCSVQEFVSDGDNLYAKTLGVVNQ